MSNHQAVVDLMNENQRSQEQVVRLARAMDKMWRSVIEYPFSKVCKHLVASNMLSDMESLGFEISKEVADAVVKCEDEVALSQPPLVYRGLPPAAFENDLAERCRELVEWKKTGLLHGGSGGKLREFARSLEYVPAAERLRVAETMTIDEALACFVSLAAAPPQPAPHEEEESTQSFGM